MSNKELIDTEELALGMQLLLDNASLCFDCTYCIEVEDIYPESVTLICKKADITSTETEFEVSEDGEIHDCFYACKCNHFKHRQQVT